MFAVNADAYITINGGNISVNANGDGIDSNGNMYLNGGYVIVDGPTNDGNGSLDYNGEFVIKGGTLLAVGSSGMMQSASNNSTQYVLALAFSTQSAGSTIDIKDSSGNTIMSYTSKKAFTSIVYSSKDLTKGSSYDVYINNNKLTTMTVSNIVTSYGNASGMMPGGMQQPQGRWNRR